MPSDHEDSAQHRALLWCGAIGAPSFVVVFLIQDTVSAIRPPGYNPLRHPVSSLAIGPSGWIQVANFLVTGVLLLAFAVGLCPALRRYNGGIWAPVLVGLVAIGLIGAGLFTADPFSGYPPGTAAVPAGASRTTHGVLHQAFSALVFFGLPAACCVLGYRFARSGRPWWACYSVGTALAFLTDFVLAGLGFAQNPTFVAIGGLLQRLTLIIGLAWLTALALHLIRRPRRHR
jgi:Protein of unknown function (DUF998)